MPTPRKPKPVHPSIYNAEKAIQRAHKAIHTNTLLYPPTFQSITLNNNNNNNNILKLNQLSSIPLHVQHQPSKVMIYWNKRTILSIFSLASLCTLPQANHLDLTKFNAGGYLRNETLITKLDVYPDMYFQNAGVELQLKASSKFKLLSGLTSISTCLFDSISVKTQWAFPPLS